MKKRSNRRAGAKYTKKVHTHIEVTIPVKIVKARRKRVEVEMADGERAVVREGDTLEVQYKAKGYSGRAPLRILDNPKSHPCTHGQTQMCNVCGFTTGLGEIGE